MIEYSIIPELLKNAISTLSTGESNIIENFRTHKIKKYETIIHYGPAQINMGSYSYNLGIEDDVAKIINQRFKNKNYTVAHRHRDVLIFDSKIIDINSVDDKDYAFNLILDGIEVHHIELISVLSKLVIPPDHGFFLRIYNFDSMKTL
ncbi:hypothetical protein XaC1_83 [Xanthomonas phage XaC1]|nr:hypothetical protein XaC1_83 [Xanthomonas phage XaC1]